jgi:hypothetical protein
VYVCTEICCLLVWLHVALKSQSWRGNRTFRMTRHLTVSTWVKTKASPTKPFDHIAHICKIVASRAWLGWLLHYYLHYSLIVVSCLACILWFVYALIWGCIWYMIFIWLLNAWVILLVIGYSDDEYGWGRVNATVGVGLHSRAVVVIVLSMRVLLRIKDCDCVDISPNLGLYSHSTMYGQGIG